METLKGRDEKGDRPENVPCLISTARDARLFRDKQKKSTIGGKSDQAPFTILADADWWTKSKESVVVASH